MKHVHTGLAVSSEENADKFFVDILGLEKREPKPIGEDISVAIFGVDQPLLRIDYEAESVIFHIIFY